MANSLTNDLYASQTQVIGAQNTRLEKMKQLANDAATGNKSQGELLKIQQDLDDEKRCYDILKQVNEALKGAMESGSKFLQAR